MNWISFAKARPGGDPQRKIWVRYIAKDSYGVLTVADALMHEAVVVWWAEIEGPEEGQRDNQRSYRTGDRT